MAAKNENVPIVVDDAPAEEDYTADALNELMGEEDFPSAAQLAAFEATVTPRDYFRSSQATGSLIPPPVAPSRANSPSAINTAGSSSYNRIAPSSRDVADVDELADFLRVALALAMNGNAMHTSLVQP